MQVLNVMMQKRNYTSTKGRFKTTMCEYVVNIESKNKRNQFGSINNVYHGREERK